MSKCKEQSPIQITRNKLRTWSKYTISALKTAKLDLIPCQRSFSCASLSDNGSSKTSTRFYRQYFASKRFAYRFVDDNRKNSRASIRIPFITMNGGYRVKFETVASHLNLPTQTVDPCITNQNVESIVTVDIAPKALKKHFESRKWKQKHILFLFHCRIITWALTAFSCSQEIVVNFSYHSHSESFGNVINNVNLKMLWFIKMSKEIAWNLHLRFDEMQDDFPIHNAIKRRKVMALPEKATKMNTNKVLMKC